MGFRLEEATIASIQAAMENGELTSRELTELYLARIEAFDRQGPAINSVLEVNPDALAIAEALDEERKQKGPRGPLHGIPILLKDNIDTHDRMHTSAGSLALADSIAREDSFVAKKLRDAGALLLGKANMTEWANFITEGMPSGYSSRGGQVLNPYGRGVLDVGGSSSGSGAATAANFAAAAIGTETSGSILNPASANSIVGIKPTVGLISRSGIIPIAHSQDTAGPMARTVEDAAILLASLTGIDPRDPASVASEGQFFNDYRPFLDRDGLRGARIGVPREFYYEQLNEEQLAVMNRAIEELKAAGAVIVDPVTIAAARELKSYAVLVYEFKPDLNAYLAGLDTQVPVHSMREVIEFNERDPERMLRYGQTLMIAAEKTGGTLEEPEYIERRELDLRLSRTEGIDKVMEERQLDAILFPNNLGAGIAAKAGYPSITVPAGYTTSGRPVGATFTAKAFQEAVLIKLAYAYEQATRHRKPPVW
jgi:amidase